MFKTIESRANVHCNISSRRSVARIRCHFLRESHFFAISESVISNSEFGPSAAVFNCTCVHISRRRVRVSWLPNSLLGQFIIVSRLCADKSAHSARPRLIEAGQINRPRTGCTDLWEARHYTCLSVAHPCIRKGSTSPFTCSYIFSLYIRPLHVPYIFCSEIPTSFRRFHAARNNNVFAIIVRVKRKKKVCSA